MTSGAQRGKANDGSQRAKNRKYALKRLWFYLSFYKVKLIIGLLLSVVANVLSLVGPALIGEMIEAMDTSDPAVRALVDFYTVHKLAIILIAFYVTSAVLNYVLSIAMAKISQGICYKLRKDVFNKLAKVPISYFDTNQTGDIISKMSYDIDTIGTSLASDLMSVINSIITLVVSFIMMLIYSPILIAVFIVTIPISFIVTQVLSKIIKKRLRVRNQQLGFLNGYTEEMITAHKTIQSYVQEDNVYEKFNKINEETAHKSYFAGRYSTIVGPSTNLISNISVILVTCAGAILSIYGLLPLAALVAFTLYSKKFSGPINQMSNLVADIQSALAASERVFGVIDQEDEKADLSEAIEATNIKGLVEFDHINFRYVENRPIINDLSFTAKPGSTVAIVGPTGAGKTTMVNLLMRFYDLNGGQIKLDGEDITNYTRSSYRKVFSMVLQDTWLFRGTVLENLLYGNGEKTLHEVMEACKKAKIHHYIKNLPNGYDTELSDEGVNISKGQKQLLVIARAMLSDSQVLILDEATSNVDTHTEVKIQEAMTNLMKDKTCFVIAHRLSTIKNADLILVLKDGDVIEQGNHQELLQQKGFYHDLFMSQFN